MPEKTKPVPVIIDTDPGVDDAIAIMLAEAAPEMELLGLTPVDGNIRAHKTFSNALALTEMTGASCPVARGAETQLEYPLFIHVGYFIHGFSGTGRLSLPKTNRAYSDLRAWDFIYKTAKEKKGGLEIIAIAPLTNIALTLRKYPDIKPLLRRITIMGGSIGKGNITRYAEFNFFADPPAAKLVFESGIPIVMAELSTTLKTAISRRFIKELGNSGAARAVQLLTGRYFDNTKNKDGERASVIHDAIPVFYTAHPEHCETRPALVTIRAERKDKRRGQSVELPDGEPNVTLITDIDMRHYEDFYRNMIAYYQDIMRKRK